MIQSLIKMHFNLLSCVNSYATTHFKCHLNYRQQLCKSKSEASEGVSDLTPITRKTVLSSQ